MDGRFSVVFWNSSQRSSSQIQRSQNQMVAKSVTVDTIHGNLLQFPCTSISTFETERSLVETPEAM